MVDSTRSAIKGFGRDCSAPQPTSVQNEYSCSSTAVETSRMISVGGECDHTRRRDCLHKTDERVERRLFAGNKPITYYSMLYGVCSYVLPKADSCILAVVLSRWDDIVGPQTVRVWLQEECGETTASQGITPGNDGSHGSDLLSKIKVTGVSEVLSENGASYPNRIGDIIYENDYIDGSNLLSAVKYVTNHTVNCLTVDANSEVNNSSLLEKGTSFFAVPDVNLVFLSLMFLVKEGEALIPYSFALIADYENYQYFLHLRGLCLQWLRRIAFRFHILLVKNSSSFDASLWKSLNEWILDFCNVLVEVKQSGLDTLPRQVPENVIKSKILKRALTSHLQTFGSSVVIGGTAHEINSMISFLAFFLEETDKHSICLINPPRKYSYHMGLKLQGLLLDEYGGRDLASLELMSNPIPVTVIDLTLGDSPSAVKQTSNFHSYLMNQQEMYRQEYRFLHQGSGSSVDHESVMHNVREASKLVSDALKDLQVLPVKYWKTYIKIFLQKLNRLALSLLSLVSWMRSTRSPDELITFPGDTKGGITLIKYLKETLRLEDADFSIVLSTAEKLKPGTYVYVMESSNP